MNKISWCLKQKKGIKIQDSNEEISKEYVKNSNETLDLFKITKGGWKNITGYYACYNLVYAILIKIGIKSEIHECTIELMNIIEYFNAKDIQLLTNLKKQRINAQYYLKPSKVKDEQIILFVEKCKIILNKLNIDEMKKIRDKLSSIQKK